MTTIAERMLLGWVRYLLAILALSLPLVSATTAVAAATPPPTAIEDQNDRLLRNLEAAQAERTQTAVALARSMERDLTRTAGVSLPPRIEDQHDRLLRNLEAGQAQRTQAAVELARSMERNFTPVAVAGVAGPQSIPRTDPADGIEMLAVVMLGLVGGLVGGIVAMAGWTATTHWRLHRVASTN